MGGQKFKLDFSDLILYNIILSERIMKNSKFVLIDPKLKQYTAYENGKKVLKVISDRPLMPSEVEDFRINPHADDEDFDGNDPDGDLVA